MKKILIVYNPDSGRGKAEKYAVKIKAAIEAKGLSAELFKSLKKQSVTEYFQGLTAEARPDSIIIVGGDGTVSSAVNAMLNAGHNIPLALFGHGTANDFSGYLKTNRRVSKFIKLFSAETYIESDVMLVNGRIYAVSSAGGGAFTNGVSRYNPTGKRLFGKAAYYFKAVGAAIAMKPQSARMTVDGETADASVHLFLAVNSANVGGLKNIAKGAFIDDGKLNIIAVKKCGFFGKLALAFSLLTRRTVYNKRVIYKTGKEVRFELTEDIITKNFTKPDIDGEGEAEFPLNIKVSDKKILVLTVPSKR